MFCHYKLCSLKYPHACLLSQEPWKIWWLNSLYDRLHQANKPVYNSSLHIVSQWFFPRTFTQTGFWTMCNFSLDMVVNLEAWISMICPENLYEVNDWKWKQCYFNHVPIFKVRLPRELESWSKLFIPEVGLGI